MNGLDMGVNADPRSNNRLISLGVDQLRNEDWLSPGEGTLTGTGVAFSFKEFRAPSISYPDAVSGYWFISRQWKPWWVSGTFDVYVWYTSGGSSTNPFYLDIRLYSAEEATDMASSPQELSSQTQIAGPSSAGVVQMATVNFSTYVSNPGGLLFWRVGRSGAHANDTNTNALEVLGVRVVFREEPRR